MRAERLDFAATAQRGLFVPVGDGQLRIDEIIGALDAANYEGWVIAA